MVCNILEKENLNTVYNLTNKTKSIDNFYGIIINAIDRF